MSSTSAAGAAPKRLHSPTPTSTSEMSKKIKVDGSASKTSASTDVPMMESSLPTINKAIATPLEIVPDSTAASASALDPNEPISISSINTTTPVTAGPPKGKKAKQQQKPFKRKVKPPKPGGAEETGHFDVLTFLGSAQVDELRALEELHGDGKKAAELEWGVGTEGKDVEVRILGMSAHGDGLATITPADGTGPTRLLTVPFTLPSELCLVHIHRHEPDTLVSHADLVTIIEPSKSRSLDDGEVIERLGAEGRGGEPSEKLIEVRKKFGTRVQCQYFGSCSGCQYQPISYESQLLLKQKVVENAFKNFSLLPASAIPTVLATLPSPKQYGYRTKLTPHFQVPPTSGKSGGAGRNQKGKGKAKAAVAEGEGQVVEEKEWEITIGFEQKGRKRIIDIEECVIATQVINDAMTIERQIVKDDISAFKRGATLLLRDSLPPRLPGTIKTSTPSTEPHVCITDHHATVREQIGLVEFEQVAGSFFQNNNSILPSLLDYVADAARATVKVTTTEPSYLIDCYCGSGLFAIGLADQFTEISGIEIDKKSIIWAKKNAEWNAGEGRGKVEFKDGKAELIFDSITFPPDLTTILIDPPRKGCDELFLSQLLAFNPATIIYVSCNVHTQAHDIGWIIRESEKRATAEVEGGEKKGVFKIESLRAADLFANTHHSEGIAIVRRY